MPSGTKMVAHRQAGVYPRVRLSRVMPTKAFLWPLILVFIALSAAAENASRPLIRTARQVQSLSRAEAARGYPVHLDRAQVTTFRPSSGRLFLIDPTGCLVADIRSPSQSSVRPGDFVSVDGITAPGDVSPLVVQAQFHVLGHAKLPNPTSVSLDRLFSGIYESHWISVEGVVKSVTPADKTPASGESSEVVLILASGQDQLEVITPVLAGRQATSLIDAKVRVRAVVAGRFNERNLLVGINLYMPDPSSAEVLEPAPADPFALPIVDVADTARVEARKSGHRVHVRGVVTSTWGDRHFSLMDSHHGIFVSTSSSFPVDIGDVLDVAGFPSAGDSSVFLDDSVARRIGSAPTPAPVRLSPSLASAGTYDAEPVEVEGWLLDRSRGDDGVVSMYLTAAGKSFVGVLPPGTPAEVLNILEPGSQLRLRGIGVIHADADHSPRAFNVLLRSTADIVVLRSPSWWTPRRALLFATLLFTIVLAVIIWNVVLRQRVRSQTRQIRLQLEESRKLRAQAEAAHSEKSEALSSLLSLQKELIAAQEELRYQATHDALTGLCNRAALLDSLHKEIERSLRARSPLGILLLDVDHFKTVNDTHGHLVGDAVLREIGSRLADATRPYDVTGRYGGEEFLILLPNCGRDETEHSAERIRAAIASIPFQSGNSKFSITVSIGATVVLGSPESDAALLNQADQALYQAKSRGRNCIVMHSRTQLKPEQTKTNATLVR